MRGVVLYFLSVVGCFKFRLKVFVILLRIVLNVCCLNFVEFLIVESLLSWWWKWLSCLSRLWWFLSCFCGICKFIVFWVLFLFFGMKGVNVDLSVLVVWKLLKLRFFFCVEELMLCGNSVVLCGILVREWLVLMSFVKRELRFVFFVVCLIIGLILWFLLFVWNEWMIVVWLVSLVSLGKVLLYVIL